jgi:undecaprenyl-diphosphatase
LQWLGFEESAMESIQAHDLGMLYWFGSLHRPGLDRVAVNLTHLGDYVVMSAIVLAAAGVFVLLHRPRLAAILLLVTVLACGVEWGAKHLVGRPRPDVAWRLVEMPKDSSFPSGHALRMMALLGCLGMLTAEIVKGYWRDVAIVAGFGLGMLIGLTRVYLGVHYPFDVLGGWIAGLACALLGGAFTRPIQPLAPRGPCEPDPSGAAKTLDAPS